MKIRAVQLDWDGVTYDSTGHHADLFPDALDTLRWLKERRIKVFIASGNREENLRILINHFMLGELIDSFRGGLRAEDKVSFLRKVAEENGLHPGEILLVDDMDEVLNCARETGCVVVGTTTGFCSYKRLVQAHHDFIISSLTKLQHLINYLNNR